MINQPVRRINIIFDRIRHTIFKMIDLLIQCVFVRLFTPIICAIYTEISAKVRLIVRVIGGLHGRIIANDNNVAHMSEDLECAMEEMDHRTVGLLSVIVELARLQTISERRLDELHTFAEQSAVARERQNDRVERILHADDEAEARGIDLAIRHDRLRLTLRFD